MNTVLVIGFIVVALLIIRKHVQQSRSMEMARIEREVDNILDIIGQDLPGFFRPDRITKVEQVSLSFEFRLIPLYRKAFARRDVKLEEAPRDKRAEYSHQLRFYRNTIPVSNYVDVTNISVVERTA
ncbi:hypothetical protein [Pseudomonas phage D6]|nr:hypothetical protein [Pseudomonas phage D6]